MYLLDADVFITAKRDYYPFDRVPEYWEWLLHHAEADRLKIPSAIWDDLQGHDDELKAWVKDHRGELVLDRNGLDVRVPEVLACYSPDLTEAEIEQIGSDPLLIGASLVVGAIVVSKEGPKPTAQRANRKVPDICKRLGVRCINDHDLIRELDFRTNWRAALAKVAAPPAGVAKIAKA